MRAFRNPGDPNYYFKKSPMATRKPKPAKKSAASRPAAGRKSSPRQRLNSLKPSGGRDDSFFELVHEVARQIPRGRVTSYGAIAAALGTRLSARMVGWAMNACHLSKKPVPAHRVVNSLGLLTGRHHFDPPEKMQLLLEKEGIRILDHQVVDFRKLFWDPSTEL
jgi:methylated-DNA-protein-cysteine methyltransferase-like protein